MAFVERGHALVGIASFDDAEVEGAFRFDEVHPAEFDLLFSGDGLGLDALGFGELSVLLEGGFQAVVGDFGVVVGPSSVDFSEESAAGGHHVDALVNSSWGRGETGVKEFVLFFVLLVGVGVVDVTAGDGDKVLGDEVKDFGSSPDKLPGLGAILSARTAGVAEVEPHDDRLVFLASFVDSGRDGVVPVDALPGEVFGAGGGVGFDLVEGVPSEFIGLILGGHKRCRQKCKDHAFIIG